MLNRKKKSQQNIDENTTVEDEKDDTNNENLLRSVEYFSAFVTTLFFLHLYHTSDGSDAYKIFWFLAGLWNITISTLVWDTVISFDTRPRAQNQSALQALSLRVAVYVFGIGYAYMMMLDKNSVLFWHTLHAGVGGKMFLVFEHFYGLIKSRPHGKEKVEAMNPLTIILIGDFFWSVAFIHIYIRAL